MIKIFIALIFLVLLIILIKKENFMIKGAYRIPEWLNKPAIPLNDMVSPSNFPPKDSHEISNKFPPKDSHEISNKFPPKSFGKLSKYIQPTGLRQQHGRPLDRDYLYGILGWPLSDWKDTARFNDTYTKNAYQYAYLPTIRHFSPYW